MKRKASFTLIELLIVIAILGILATAVMVAINPGRRLRQSRDAQRKNDITAIANALVGYYTLTGEFPSENACDSSIGLVVSGSCPPPTIGTDWDKSASSHIYQNLVAGQGFLKDLPKDPVNNYPGHWYKYEPSYQDDGGPGFSECSAGGQPCSFYWIGVVLEEPSPGKSIFRCTDLTQLSFGEGPGCKEVFGLINSGALP